MTYFGCILLVKNMEKIEGVKIFVHMGHVCWRQQFVLSAKSLISKSHHLIDTIGKIISIGTKNIKRSYVKNARFQSYEQF